MTAIAELLVKPPAEGACHIIACNDRIAKMDNAGRCAVVSSFAFKKLSEESAKGAARWIL
jgi:hypothetical protein